MEKNWVCIFTTKVSYLAEIAKDLLHENEINAVIINKQDINYHFGVLEVYVERDHAIRGKHLLKDIRKV